MKYEVETGFESLVGYHIGQEVEKELYDDEFLSFTLKGKVTLLEKCTNQYGKEFVRVYLTKNNYFVEPLSCSLKEIGT